MVSAADYLSVTQKRQWHPYVIGEIAVPTPIVAGSVIRIDAICYTPSQISVNRFDYRVVSITGSPTDKQVIDAWDVLAAPRYKAIIGTGASYRGSRLTQLIAPVPVPVFQNANDGPGLTLGNMLPTQTAGVVTKLTNFRGRRNRGRTYLPFPSAASDDPGGGPTAGYVTNASLLAILVFTPANYGTVTDYASLQPYLVHGHTIPPTGTDVIGYNARLKWGTQRKRGQYGRTNVLPF
jgi:hypothetical protein